MLLSILATPARSLDIASLVVESLHSESLAAQDLSVQVEFIQDRELLLTLTAAAAGHTESGRFRDIELNCPVSLADDGSLTCRDGQLRALQDPGGRIDGRIDVRLDRERRFSGRLRLQGADIRVNSLMGLLQVVLQLQPMPEITGGELDFKMDLQLEQGRPRGLDLQAELRGLNIEGNNVMQSVAMQMALDARYVNEGWRFDTRVSATDGLMYLVPGVEILGDIPGFYLDGSTADLEFTARGWTDPGFDTAMLENFSYSHPGLLTLTGSARLHKSASGPSADLRLAVDAPDLAAVYPVYIEPILLSTRYAELELAGALQLQLGYEQNVLKELDLVLEDVFLDDAGQRFSVSGLAADLAIGAAVAERVSHLEWRSMSLYRLILGAGDITMLTGGDRLEVVDWRDVDVLDGTLLINQLSLSDIGSEDFSLRLHGELTPVSLKTFTQTMGWPLMSGKLSGAIDGLEYTRGELRVNGDLVFRVFDGDIVLDGLRIQNLFDVNSRFYTNITINDLDLLQVTDTFSFGKIEGSLEGYVRDLTLNNWQPVYFDAVLRNPEKDPRPHRISRKALDNLSEIGGGLPGSLSQGLVRFLPEYSYGRLGIRCLLSNNVCNLGGIEEAGDGFYIMTRGGLLPPWVDVKGTGRSIIWRDLVGGLKRIAEGEVVFD